MADMDQTGVKEIIHAWIVKDLELPTESSYIKKAIRKWINEDVFRTDDSTLASKKWVKEWVAADLSSDNPRTIASKNFVLRNTRQK